MSDLNALDSLIEGLNSPFRKVIVEGLLDGKETVHVLAAEVGDSGNVIPLAILMEGDLYERVQPVGFDAESDEQARRRINGGGDAA